MNDGLALPAVLILLASTGHTVAGEATSVPMVLLELAGGLVLGVLAPLVAGGLVRLPGSVPPRLQPLGPLAVGVVIYAVSGLTHVNSALLTPTLFGDVAIIGYVRRELLAAAWFGPKGFASVVYGLHVLHSGTPQAEQIYQLVAVTIALSIAAHSSSDVPVARLFHVEDVANAPHQDPPESNDDRA